MELWEREISRERIYEGKIFTVDHLEVELPNGRVAGRDVVNNADAVAVVALDGQENVLMVRQYRVAAEAVLTEIPAGKLDAGEDPETGALRELREETGCIPGKLTYLFGLRMTPGCVTETIHIYLAEDLSFTDTDPDEDEFLEILRVPLKDALAQVLDGTLCDGKTAAGILAAAQRKR